MFVCAIVVLILPVVLYSAPAFAGENLDVEEKMLSDLLDSFDEDDNNDRSIEESGSVTESTQPWTLSGAVTLSSHYNIAHKNPEGSEFDFRGISRRRVKLNLDGSVKLSDNWAAIVTGHGYYDAAYTVADQEKQEIETGETFIRGNLTSKLDITFGRQIAVWGMSDNVRVTDILNPLDNRTPGIIEIKDRRLPLVMTRLDYYHDVWNISAITIHEIRFNKNPAVESEFYANKNPLPSEEIPSDGGSNTEFALALQGSFQGWDMSFYGARLFDDQAYLAKDQNGPGLKHGRYTMLGLAADAVLDSYIFKAESAHFSGLKYSSLPDEKRNRTDFMFGVEYDGMTDTTLSFEIVLSHLHDYGSTLKKDAYSQNDLRTALRYQGKFIYDRLTIILMTILLGSRLEQGGFTRFETDYELKDALTLGTGFIIYYKGSRIPFNAIHDNDRIFVDITYSF